MRCNIYLLSDIITYVRRLVKTPSNNVLTDALIIDFINRFWINDVDARIQLFDLKTKYQFQTAPGYDQYNMPVYNIQTEPGPQTISYYPLYQGFLAPAYINGIQVPLLTQKQDLFNMYPNVVQQMNVVATGNGGATYTFTFPISPINQIPLSPSFEYILRGHVDIQGCTAIANSGIVSYIDPPIVTNTQALTTIPSAPVANVFPAVYITTNGDDGSSIVVSDSGQFLSGAQNYGLLMSPGMAPNGNTTLPGEYLNSFAITGVTQASQAVLTATTVFQPGQTVLIQNVVGMTELNNNTYVVVANGGTTLTIDVDSTGFTPYVSGGTVSSLQNVINYFTGEVNVTFPVNIPQGVAINAQCYFFQTGLPRTILFYNNTLTLRSPPDRQYLVELDAYLTPAGFLATNQSIQFGYMTEYIARGAARKILSDTGDWDQFNAYEPLFREQEALVWKRSQRQFTATRTQTIYSQGVNQGPNAYFGQGGSSQ